MSNSPQRDLASDERIAIVDLADELQIRKQTIFKIVKRLGIRPTGRRESSRRNQKVATIGHAEATAIKNQLRQSASSRPGNGDVPTGIAFIADEVGMFYLIQLEPDHDPRRFKVGFTTELEGRLRKHRCSAPFARTVKSWPCRRTWERAAIDCVTDACERLHTEVFRAASIDELVARADRFFALMPSVR